MTASSNEALERFHRRARETGVSGPLYALVRSLLSPLLRLWFRVRIAGAEHIPPEGAAIVAPNHKSFLDAFFVGIATRRHVRYMAKTELFRGPLGWLFVRLGAFPVRRGQADAEAIETARTILEQGGLLVMFPEGTRVEQPDALGSPHHGAGRLALEVGAPVIPAAISGTDHLWLGPIPKPRRVQLTFLAPLDPHELAGRPDAVSELVDRELWPAVRQQYGRQLARPGLLLAALTAVGFGGRLLARRRARAATPRLLGVVQPLKQRRREARRRLLRTLARPAAPIARAARANRKRCTATDPGDVADVALQLRHEDRVPLVAARPSGAAGRRRRAGRARACPPALRSPSQPARRRRPGPPSARPRRPLAGARASRRTRLTTRPPNGMLASASRRRRRSPPRPARGSGEVTIRNVVAGSPSSRPTARRALDEARRPRSPSTRKNALQVGEQVDAGDAAQGREDDAAAARGDRRGQARRGR